MYKTDFLPVVVKSNELEEEVYTSIFSKIEMYNPVIIDGRGFNTEEKLAMGVADVIDGKKAIILALKHYSITFCYDLENVTLVTFDKDNDSELEEEKLSFYFHNGSFLAWRKGNTKIIGTSVNSDIDSIETYSAWKPYKVLESEILENVFLSLDIDVFKKKITRAYNIHTRFPLKRMGFDDVCFLSKEIIKGRELKGINIAEYNPLLDKPDFKTADLLTDYLLYLLS